MTDNKIFCSADEFAWLENGLAAARRAYEYATTKAKPNSAIAASAPKHKADMALYEKALELFAVRPDSVKSEQGQVLSVEFQEAFSKIQGSEVKTFDHYPPEK